MCCFNFILKLFLHLLYCQLGLKQQKENKLNYCYFKQESGDFSNYQMSRLLKRRSVQVSLEEAEKEMGGRTLSLGDVEALLAEGGVEINPQLTKRIASDEVTRYIYVRGEFLLHPS